jgi:hypothetical protein
MGYKTVYAAIRCEYFRSPGLLEVYIALYGAQSLRFKTVGIRVSFVYQIPIGIYHSIPVHNSFFNNGSNDLPTRTTLVRPHHLPRRQLIRTMPRLEVDALVVVLERRLDSLEERFGLVLVDAYIVADREDDFADLLLLAVFVVLLVFVERDGDVDAGFSGPGGVDSEPI